MAENSAEYTQPRISRRKALLGCVPKIAAAVALGVTATTIAVSNIEEALKSNPPVAAPKKP